MYFVKLIRRSSGAIKYTEMKTSKEEAIKDGEKYSSHIYEKELFYCASCGQI